MKPKRKLKRWVVTTLLILPELIMIIELFLIAQNLKEIKNDTKKTTNIICNCNNPGVYK